MYSYGISMVEVATVMCHSPWIILSHISLMSAVKNAVSQKFQQGESSVYIQYCFIVPHLKNSVFSNCQFWVISRQH